jgi:hypothetical protein
MNTPSNYQKNESINCDLMCRFNREYPTLGYPKIYVELKINFSEWLETGNPDYLDKTILVCAKHNVPMAGVLLEQLAVASLKRLKKGYTNIYKQKATKVNKNAPSNEAHWMIFKLTYFCNKFIYDASFLSAGWLDMTFPLYSKKASVLEKEHKSWVDKNKDDIEYIKTEVRPEGWSKLEQDEFLTNFPKNISESLRGNRRI